MSFLSDLSLNNNREWMEKNKKSYQKAKKEFTGLVSSLIVGIRTFDDTVGELEAKNCIFRLHRDLRFSKDKRPYKENFGASMTKGGRKSKFAGYYIHLQPGNKSAIAGGLYMPEGDVLKKVRQEIDYNLGEFNQILSEKSFKKTFQELKGEKLKTAPKGYPKDHPGLEYLKHKSFFVYNELKDDEVLNSNFENAIVEQFSKIKSLNDFLNRAVKDSI